MDVDVAVDVPEIVLEVTVPECVAVFVFEIMDVESVEAASLGEDEDVGIIVTAGRAELETIEEEGLTCWTDMIFGGESPAEAEGTDGVELDVIAFSTVAVRKGATVTDGVAALVCWGAGAMLIYFPSFLPWIFCVSWCICIPRLVGIV